MSYRAKCSRRREKTRRPKFDFDLSKSPIARIYSWGTERFVPKYVGAVSSSVTITLASLKNS